jgi:hypothetical protein
MNSATFAANTRHVRVLAPIKGAPFGVGDTLTIDRLCKKLSPWVMIEYEGYRNVIRANKAVRHHFAHVIVGEVVMYRRPGRALV